MNNQLSLFGVSHDQNVFQSVLWGQLNFVQCESKKWTDTCRHCLLWVHKDSQTENDECISAPCSSEDREDGKNGYFSIQEMPQIIK